MQTKAKSNSVVTHRLLETGELEFRVKMGADQFQTFTFDRTKASAANRVHAELHGWIQRIADKAAILRDPETGLAATPETKFNRMKELAEHYETGSAEWSPKRSASEGGADAGLIITAMTRALTGGDIDKANTLVQGLADKRAIDRKAALREWAKTKQVADAIAQIRAERATGNADDLIGEIMGQEEGSGE